MHAFSTFVHLTRGPNTPGVLLARHDTPATNGESLKLHFARSGDAAPVSVRLVQKNTGVHVLLPFYEERGGILTVRFDLAEGDEVWAACEPPGSVVAWTTVAA